MISPENKEIDTTPDFAPPLAPGFAQINLSTSEEPITVLELYDYWLEELAHTSSVRKRQRRILHQKLEDLGGCAFSFAYSDQIAIRVPMEIAIPNFRDTMLKGIIQRFQTQYAKDIEKVRSRKYNTESI